LLPFVLFNASYLLASDAFFGGANIDFEIFFLRQPYHSTLLLSLQSRMIAFNWKIKRIKIIYFTRFFKADTYYAVQKLTPLFAGKRNPKASPLPGDSCLSFLIR
jgi:hypothetical protein